MSTEAQVAANRANAEQSTGPKRKKTKRYRASHERAFHKC